MGDVVVKPENVIVWDLDGTLGQFSSMPMREGGEPITVLLRHGLADALRDLSAAGVVHTVLTMATPLYAEMVLHGTGLRPFFRFVEGQGQRYKGDAAGIGAALGLSADDLPHRMLFIGDHPYNDAPKDRRVLFHFEPQAMARSARDVGRMVHHLLNVGQGSFQRGFESLMGQPSLWNRLWSRKPETRPIEVDVPGVGRLGLAERAEDCSVIWFAQPSQPPVEPTRHEILPSEVLAQIRNDLPGPG
jgi:hypothetical protein